MVTNRDRKSFGSRRKISKYCSDDWHRWRFWSAFRHFGTHFTESFRHVQIFVNGGPNPLTWDAQLFSYWFSPNPTVFDISSWIWSVISGVVTVLCRPGRGASQADKSPRFNWSTQFLTVAYDGACSRNDSFWMAWVSFGALPCRCWWGADDSSRLDVVAIARVAWHASFQPL